jgi:hypothetical protein
MQPRTPVVMLASTAVLQCPQCHIVLTASLAICFTGQGLLWF